MGKLFTGAEPFGLGRTQSGQPGKTAGSSVVTETGSRLVGRAI